MQAEQPPEPRLVDHRHAQLARLLAFAAAVRITITNMDELSFLVQGSAEEPYTVQFRKSGNNLSAYCTCPAGAVGQICKHRMRILEGTTDGIVSGNEGEVVKAVSWLAGSDVETALAELRAAESRLETAQKEVTALKKKLARVLTS